MPPKTTSSNTAKPQNRPPLKNPSAKPVSNTTKAPVRTPSAPSKPAGSTVRPTPRHPPSATKPATSATPKAPAKPAQQPAQEGNWLNRAVQNSVAGVGNYAGGFFTSIGNSVNKVGEGVGNKINDTTRYWGQGVAGYGNNIKDSVGVGGPRIATGGNPLGLAGQGSSQNQPSGKPQSAVRSGGKGGGANPLGL